MDILWIVQRDVSVLIIAVFSESLEKSTNIIFHRYPHSSRGQCEQQIVNLSCSQTWDSLPHCHSSIHSSRTSEYRVRSWREISRTMSTFNIPFFFSWLSLALASRPRQTAVSSFFTVETSKYYCSEHSATQYLSSGCNSSLLSFHFNWEPTIVVC